MNQKKIVSNMLSLEGLYESKVNVRILKTFKQNKLLTMRLNSLADFFYVNVL